MPATRERTNPQIGNDNRRDELVRAAAQLFREKGFEATTIRDIAGAVGMQSGSPFYHFANKHELLENARGRRGRGPDAEGRLGADARIARPMILGAINFSATWYRARPRSRAGVDLDTLAAETSALLLREAPP